MKRYVVSSVVAVVAILIVVSSVSVAAQIHGNASPRYKLIDMGTFGGPNSRFSYPGSRLLNSSGAFAGDSETTVPDPGAPNCGNPDCFLSRPFLYRNGHRTELSTLPGGEGSSPAAINARGVVAGASGNGKINPVTGQPQNLAVVWKPNGYRIKQLASLGGKGSTSLDINDRGQVAGWAVNKVPYTTSLWGNQGTEQRAVIWQNGKVKDLGSLGGPSAVAYVINSKGQAAGQGQTSSKVNSAVGGPPTAPFLWRKGDGMTNLGTLGGSAGIALTISDRGEVAGQSDLKGDKKSHPFVWKPGDPGLTDLGTLGGDNGIAFWMNNAGDVVGAADPKGSPYGVAFLWSKGRMKNLGTLKGDNCSQGYYVNSHDQVVGGSAICPQVGNSDFMNAFLWDKGHMVNLNTLVARPASGLRITVPGFINDRGDIGAFGVLPDGHFHAVLLVPRK